MWFYGPERAIIVVAGFAVVFMIGCGREGGPAEAPPQVTTSPLSQPSPTPAKVLTFRVEMYRGNARRTGAYDPDSQKMPIGRLKWRRKTWISTDPIVAGGNVYHGNSNGALVALDAASGKTVWKIDRCGGFGSTPAWRDGVIYHGHCNRTFYAIDASSNERWHFDASEQIHSSPAIADGSAYFGNIAGQFYAVDLVTGKARWEIRVGRRVCGSPAVGDGKVFVAGDTRGMYVLHALEAKTGGVLWTFSREYAPMGTSVLADGVVYTGAGRELIALDAQTGEVSWRHRFQIEMDRCVGTPAVVKGVAYLGTSDGKLFAVDVRTREELWVFETGGYIGAYPAVANGVVYFGSADERLYAVDAETGRERWRFRVAAGVSHGPVVHDGVVYFGTGNGMLYAIQ